MTLRQEIDDKLVRYGKTVLPNQQIILVGSNPLPAYVALLALAPEKAWLLCSGQTRSKADRIREAYAEAPLGSGSLRTVVEIREFDDVSSEMKVRERMQRLQEELRDEGNDFRICGLHYTGGTKSMAVHTYRAWAKDGVPRHFATYLDARKMALRFDGLPAGLDVDISLRPKISLETLLALHGVEKMNADGGKVSDARKYWSRVIFSDVTQMQDGSDYALALPPHVTRSCEVRVPSSIEEYPAYITLKIMRGRSNSIVVMQKKSKQEQWFGEWRVVQDQMKTLTPVSEVTNEMPDSVRNFRFTDIWGNLKRELRERGHDDSFPEFVNFLNDKGFNGKYKNRDMDEKMYKWLEAGWLEDYVVTVLEDLRDELDIHEIWGSTDLCLNSDKQRQFEMDVVFMRGHVPHVISCTTDTKYHAKMKLFEVQSRAALLGGDHARFALVSFTSEKGRDKLKSELREDWDEVTSYDVFGFEDVKNPERFKKGLQEWILQKDRK